MLDSLPPEIIEQVLSYLPTASAVTNVACTNRKLYSVVSAENYAILREFVQKAFASITTPPFWREVTWTLTSRSRAWDRKSFIARECYPSNEEVIPARPNTYQTFGYIPVIDSYEQWPGDSFVDRKQVVAIGVGGRLRVRSTHKGSSEWKIFKMPEDHLQQNDIVDVRLLRPHQHQNRHGETIIIRRANKEIVKVESGVGKDNIVQTTQFLANDTDVDCLDVNASTEPMMIVCNAKSLQLFAVNTASDRIRPCSTSSLVHNFGYQHRKRCVRYLDDHTIATGVQFLEGFEKSPILIYDVRPTGVVASGVQPTTNVDFDDSTKGRNCANIIVSLDNTASLAARPGQVFLSGWTDGAVRLHDLRTPAQLVRKYTDEVDDGQILSLSVIGHERFFAGSHQNACLKTFDMRMPGAHRTYSYLDASPRQSNQSNGIDVNAARDNARQRSQRDINIFLAFTFQRNRAWTPLHQQSSQNARGSSRYRGSVYSLSTPSPTSSTLFAGIENHIIQLDFVNTDDILQQYSRPSDPAMGLKTLTSNLDTQNVLSLSCYERPRSSHVSTDTVLLRNQIDWHEVESGGISEAKHGVAEDGWDERWRLAGSWRNRDSNSNVPPPASYRGRRWRRGNTT